MPWDIKILDMHAQYFQSPKGRYNLDQKHQVNQEAHKSVTQ